jgi:hypothetical protein
MAVIPDAMQRERAASQIRDLLTIRRIPCLRSVTKACRSAHGMTDGKEWQ